MPILVPAAARAMLLIEVFAREKRELGNSELARFLEMPESSCSDLVHTLIESGYLTRTVNSRRVYPTGRLLEMGKQISTNDPLVSAALEACDFLRDKTGETAICGKLESGFVRVVAAREGRHLLRYSTVSGDKLALHVSAMGKMLLARGTREEAERQLRLKPLRQLSSATVTDVAALLQQIAAAGRQGYCLIENEGGEGLAALAVDGLIAGVQVALSLAGPAERLKLNREAYLAALRDVQSAISGQSASQAD